MRKAQQKKQEAEVATLETGNVTRESVSTPKLNIEEPMKKMNRKLAHFLMVFLVTSWGLEYSIAKNVMVVVDSLTLIFFKYVIALLVIMVMKLIVEGKGFFKKQDIWLFVVCAGTGEILYFYMEYEAMNYMPISLITIILSFVPIVSIFVEWMAFRKAPSLPLLAGIGVCILGLILIIGIDIETILQGRLVGYLLSFGAVFSWNIYNFMTSYLGGRYQTMTLAVNQLICTVLLVMPIALANLPDPADLTMPVIGGILYLGVVSSGIGFVIYVAAVYSLGPTTVSVYANFMPVTATFFGWVILGEMISPLQMIGGLIVIGAGYYVIREKGKLEERSNV